MTYKTFYTVLTWLEFDLATVWLKVPQNKHSATTFELFGILTISNYIFVGSFEMYKICLFWNVLTWLGFELAIFWLGVQHGNHSATTFELFDIMLHVQCTCVWELLSGKPFRLFPDMRTSSFRASEISSGSAGPQWRHARGGLESCHQATSRSHWR